MSKSNREAGFETKTIEAEKQQDDIFNMLRADHCQLRTLRSVKTAFKNVCKEKKKTFSNKQNLRGLISTRHSLKEMAKGDLISPRKIDKVGYENG